MINGSLEQFLDTGWYQDAELFYGGFIYWCEGTFDGEKWNFRVDRWRARIVGDKLYSSYLYNGDFVDFKTVFNQTCNNLDLIKKNFLESKVFNEKTFWSIESEIMWVEWSKETVIEDINDIYDL